MCHRCSLWALGLLTECRDGPSECRAVPLAGWWKRFRIELKMGRCPRSADPGCGCALHRELTGPDAPDAWCTAFGLDPGEASAPAPAPKPEEPPSRLAPTAGAIRRAGFAWPPPGADVAATRPDSAGRIDLSRARRELGESLAFQQREYDAAAQMAREASTVSYGDAEDASDARREIATRMGGLRRAIEHVDRVTAHLREQAAAPEPDRRGPDRTHDRERPKGSWSRNLLLAYLAAAVLGMALLSPALLGMPTAFPRVEWSKGMSEEESIEAGKRVLGTIDAGLPTTSTWMLLPRDDWFEYLETVLVPSTEYRRRSSTVEERVGEFNAGIEDLAVEYERSALLLAGIFTAGLGCALLALLRPGLGSALLVSLIPLSSTAIATDLLLGWENERLMMTSSPMIAAGLGLLAIRFAQRALRGTAGPRGDSWALVWEGLFLLVLGGGMTVAAFAWAVDQGGPGVLYAAVGPTLYGLWRLIRGVAGLLRSLRRR
jgi:hypothetical protein